MAKGSDSSGKDDKVVPLRPRRPCPECGRPSAAATFPFCSPRCKDVDLSRWLTGGYAIAGDPETGPGTPQTEDDD